MGKRGGLVVYTTSHGFGHLNRSSAVINRMAPEVPVTIRCHPDLFDHWRERLRRPASLEPYVSDVGALGPPGDSQATDMAATIATAARVHAEAMGRVDVEAQALRDGGAAAVLCDAPAVPFGRAARGGAGVPAGQLHLGRHLRAARPAPGGRGVPPGLRAARGLSTGHADLPRRAALRMAGIAPVTDVGMVVTPGHNRGGPLRKELGLAPGTKLVYCYFGRYGQANLGFDRLERLGAKGVHFVGFHPAPSGPLRNLHVVSASEWTGADLAASSDAMVVKAGYGTACEAMTSGTPMIYPPRTGFAEHRALDRALRDWGGGVPASARAFEELRLDRLLDRAFALKPGPAPFPADGALRVAERLALTCGAMPSAR